MAIILQFLQGELLVWEALYLMNKIAAIIIDDEPEARNNLKNLLKLSDAEVEILADFDNGPDAIEFVRSTHVDCIFLDIELPKMSGFQFLERVELEKTFVIFVTAHTNYAIRALRANAIDYILKPIDFDELETSLRRLSALLHTSSDPYLHQVYRESFQNLISYQKSGIKSSKITLPTSNGFKIIDSSNIVRVEADGGYSRILFSERKQELVTRNLGHFESILDDSKFLRIHYSHIVNLDFIEEYSGIDGGIVLMKDGSSVVIAQRRMKDFKAKVDEYYS